MKKELYIGLDVHREAVAIAVAEQGRKGEVRAHRTRIENRRAMALHGQCSHDRARRLIAIGGWL